MSLNTFEKVERQKARQHERDQHLDFMSGASGVSDSSIGGIDMAHLTGSQNSHGDAVRSARDFLWDNGDEEENYANKVRQQRNHSSHPPREAFHNELDDGDFEFVDKFSRPKVSVMQKARKMKSKIPKIMTGAGSNHDQISMGRNSRMPSPLVGNAGRSADDDTEEFVNTKRLAKTHQDFQRSRRRRWVIGVISIFLILFVVVYLQNSGDESTTSSGSESTSNDVDADSPSDDTDNGTDTDIPPGSPQPPIKKSEERFEAVLDRITASGYSDASLIAKDGSPQHKALRWISDFDPFQVHPDSDAILQRYALAVLFFTSNTNHDPDTDMRNGANSRWTQDEYWMSEKGICMWHGVDCPMRVHMGTETTQYNENIDIVGLTLPQNKIVGTIPNEIGALESLTSLVLSKNELTGSIPSIITTFEMLEILDLSDNSLTGLIPEAVDNLLSLTKLKLSKNQFDGSIPKQIGNLLDLETLDLWGNKLGGTIPVDIVSCKKLKIIDVSYNSLHGNIPNDIKSLTSLTVFAANRNTFVGELPWLEGVDNLDTLDLSQNEFDGSLPKSYGELTNLRNLHLHKNKLGNSIPEEIGKLTKLEHLSLQLNQFTGELPDVFWEMKNMRELELSFNSFKGQLPADIDDLSKLELLLFNDNQFSGNIPVSYEGFGNLEVMHLQNNAFTGSIPDGFQMLSSLRHMNLSGNSFDGTIPHLLGEATKLEVIELQQNELEGFIPSDLSSLPRLQTLNVEGNRLLGTVPDGLCEKVDNGILLSFTADCAETNKPGSHIVCSCCTECFDP